MEAGVVARARRGRVAIGVRRRVTAVVDHLRRAVVARRVAVAVPVVVSGDLAREVTALERRRVGRLVSGLVVGVVELAGGEATRVVGRGVGRAVVALRAAGAELGGVGARALARWAAGR